MREARGQWGLPDFDAEDALRDVLAATEQRKLQVGVEGGGRRDGGDAEAPLVDVLPAGACCPRMPCFFRHPTSVWPDGVSARYPTALHRRCWSWARHRCPKRPQVEVELEGLAGAVLELAAGGAAAQGGDIVLEFGTPRGERQVSGGAVIPMMGPPT